MIHRTRHDRCTHALSGACSSRRTTAAALILAVCVAGAAMGPALGDSINFLGAGGGTYWYLATSSDFGWEGGDVISLTGLEEVTGANQPFGFSVAYTPYSVAWTCTQPRFGLTAFSIQSVAESGQVPYSIASEDPSSGWIPGPAYAPEPTTVAMFCTGLAALAGVAWRRRRSPKAAG